MAKVCQITGKKAMVGNHVSHSNNRIKRRFKLNIHKQRFYLDSEDRWIELMVSTTGIKTIHKLGLENALKKAKQKGYITNY